MTESQQSPASRKYEYAIAGALALVISCVLCAPRWLEGESVFKGVIQEQYYILGQFSFDHQIIEDFQASRFPLWNPHNALGTPLLGNMLSSVFYPLKALIYFCNTIWMRDIFIILRLWLAGFFAYVFARSRGLGISGSVLVMAGFSLTGYFRVFINENYLNADVLIPLLLISFDRVARGGKIHHVMLAGIIIFAILNNGHPEAAFYALLFGGLYFLASMFSGKSELRLAALGRVLSSVVLGFILSLPMLLPFIEYWSRGLHFHPPGAGFYHYPIRQAIALLSPWFFKQPGPGAPFLGPVNMAWNMLGQGIPDYSITAVPWLIPYAGMTIFFLALLSGLRLKRLDSRSVFFVAFSVFFLGVMFGLPGFNLIGFVPVFNFSGNFKHPMPAVMFAMAFLAGKALDDIIRSRISFRQVLIAGAALFFIIIFFGFVHQPLSAGINYLNPETGLQVLILACLVLWLLAAAGWRAPSWLVGAVAAVSLVSGLAISSFWHKSFNPDYLARLEESPALNYLKKMPGPFRTYIMQGIMPPNLNIVHGLSDLRVMDGVNDQRFVDVVNRINGMERLAALDYWYMNVGYLQPMPEKAGHPLFRLFNVRYILSDNPLPYNNSISYFLDNSSVLAPTAGHLGRIRLPFCKGRADALFQHPPCKLEIDIMAGEDLYLSFQPGIDRCAWPLEHDGAWFEVYSGVVMGHQAGSSSHLVYSRYLDPGGHEGDHEVPRIVLPLQGRINYLAFMTLPHSSADHDWSGWADLRLGPPRILGQDDYRLVMPGHLWLYEGGDMDKTHQAQERAFLAGRAEFVPDESRVLELIAEPDHPYDRRVLVSGINGGIPFTAPVEWMHEWETGAGLGQVEFEFYSPQKILLSVKALFDSWLVLSDLYYPGWRALVDGKPRRIFRGDYLLRALPIKAGEHSVEFIYMPFSFRIGLWLSLASLLVMVLVQCFKRLISRMSA